MNTNIKQASKKEYNIILNKLVKIIPGETSNTVLKQMGRQYFGNNFIGVFSSDMVRRLRHKESCIINLDPGYMEGSHWVALARYKNNYYFYDSFGRTPKKILPFLYNMLKRPIRYDTKDREQKDNESNCGARCLASLFIFYDRNFGPHYMISI